MTESTFGFQVTTLSMAISIMAMVAVCTLGWWAWVRSGYRRSILLLELLRICIVGFVVFLLNQPETVQRFVPTDKPTVVVLVDGSKSMDTLDVQVSPDRSVPPMTRRSAAEPLLANETWKELSERFEVVVTPFASEEGGLTSDLGAAIDKSREQNPNLRAMILASDGDWNTGSAPVQAATKLRVQQIPILAVPLGSQSRLPDLDLVSFDLPTFGVAGKSVRIPLTIESSMPRDHVTQVELKISDGTVIKHQVQIGGMGRTSDAIIWKPENVGDYTLELSVPEHPDEIVTTNNKREAPIAIREEKLKVLVIETLPRWEYRFLRNALSRDPGVEVSCLLFHPGLSKVGGGNRDYIPNFPDSLEQLSQYDVIFLGDVGVQDGQMTAEQAELIKGLVEQQASGLVFMPGIKGYQQTIVGSPLDPLLPVVFDDSQPTGWGSRTPSHFALTEFGRTSLLTKLADTAEDNMQVWEGLPGFQWHAPVIRAKAGTDVLAVHQESSNQYGRLPLLVTRTFGSGKILFMGTEGAWRWRRGVEDLYHYRFWGQVVRWMAYQRNMAKGELMRLYYAPEQPQVRQTVALSANVMSRSGEPLSKGDVTVRLVAPSGRIHSVQLANTGVQWGAFSGNFVPEEPGVHQVKLRCLENSSELDTTIFVHGNTLEQVGRPARIDVMEELARVTRGKIIKGAELAEINKAVSAVSDPPEVIRRVQLWSHPLVAGLLISLLAIFWVGRKVIGVI
jgi:hypothetical protein